MNSGGNGVPGAGEVPVSGDLGKRELEATWQQRRAGAEGDRGVLQTRRGRSHRMTGSATNAVAKTRLITFRSRAVAVRTSSTG